jgi:ribosomal protein S18 acetylase RimI-like enzyme
MIISKRPAKKADLPTVRRFEAAGFRAWPATNVHYDGTWVVRLTRAQPSKRLNSVNPLDPDDLRDLPQRIEAAGRRFEAFCRPLVFRLSPLAGDGLEAHLARTGFRAMGESLVMRLDLDSAAVDDAMDQIPLKDLARFAGAALSTRGGDAAGRSGLIEVIGAIRAEPGLFVLERDETPVATAVCVHDGDLAGLFEVVTKAAERGRGFGRWLVLSALKWARLRGARTAWLQVEADNAEARRLYEAIGFREIYRYHYRVLEPSA